MERPVGHQDCCQSGKTVVETEIRIIDLTNQTLAEGVIPAKWKLNTTVNCYHGKGDTLER